MCGLCPWWRKRSTQQRGLIEMPDEFQDLDGLADNVDVLLKADAMNVARAQGNDLPVGSTWHKWDGAELEPLLAHTTVIDARWLLKLSKGEVMPEREGVVPAWQELPPQAVVTLAALRNTTLLGILPIAVLSYGWASRAHPDPTGEQLRRLQPALEAMLCGWSSDNPAYHAETWGVVWDFASLPQRGYTTGYVADELDISGQLLQSNDDRTPYQQARFAAGLRAINRWYAHPYTTTLVCDWSMPDGAENDAHVGQRGWCLFERHLSSMTKASACCLSLSRLPQMEASNAHWQDVVVKCRAGRLAPLTPDAFDEMLRKGIAREAVATGSGVRFTNGKDATHVCIPQFREAFLRLFSKAERLLFGDIAWTDADVRQLAVALIFAHEAGATSKALLLTLGDNKLTAAAVAPIVEVLTAGALPHLRLLSVQDNDGDLTDAGRSQLQSACEGQGAEALFN